MKMLTGKVVSDKMLNTLVVEVVRQSIHPLYKKILRRSKRFKVHNTDSKIKTGDTVKIAETKPMSKEKYFKVVEKI